MIFPINMMAVMQQFAIHSYYNNDNIPIHSKIHSKNYLSKIP